MWMFLEPSEMRFLRIFVVFILLSGSRGTSFSDILWKVYAFSLKLGPANLNDCITFLLYFKIPGRPERASKTRKTRSGFFCFVQCWKIRSQTFCFHLCVICGVLFRPGDAPKEGNSCPIYETVLFEVPGSSGVCFWCHFELFCLCFSCVVVPSLEWNACFWKTPS